MKRRKLTAIRTETIERVVVRLNVPEDQGESSAAGFCRKCNDETEWLGLTKAAAFGDLTLETIRELIELGSLHFLIKADGQLVICATSLAQQAVRPKEPASIELSSRAELCEPVEANIMQLANTQAAHPNLSEASIAEFPGESS